MEILLLGRERFQEKKKDHIPVCFPHQPGLPYASSPKAETPPVFCSYFVGSGISDSFSVY